MCLICSAWPLLPTLLWPPSAFVHVALGCPSLRRPLEPSTSPWRTCSLESTHTLNPKSRALNRKDFIILRARGLVVLVEQRCTNTTEIDSANTASNKHLIPAASKV